MTIGGCWVATVIATNHLFKRRSLRRWLITSGHHVQRFAPVGAAFGMLG